MRQKPSSALNKHSAIMLFVLSLMTVYREVFEAVLFYATLWSEGNGIYLLAGLGSGIAILAAITVVLLRSSARLPIHQFFTFSSTLVAVLAVVLIGRRVAALQGIGFLHITPISMPRIGMLGVYSSVQTALAQVATLSIITGIIAYNMQSVSSKA